VQLLSVVLVAVDEGRQAFMEWWGLKDFGVKLMSHSWPGNRVKSKHPMNNIIIKSEEEVSSGGTPE
jgi:hypothetical protein